MNQEWIHLETVSSTNSYLSQLARENPPGHEVVVVAEFQSNGKGQGANSWFSDPGENLLMSVLLYPEFLSASDQFNLSVMTSLAICDLVRSAVKDPVIKWPNDILVRTGKMAGILIENSIISGRLSHTVIGIGLNVNQGRFPVFPWKATSLARETGKRYDPAELAADLARILLEKYVLLKERREEMLREAYLEHLYLLDRPAMYRAGEEVFQGIIRGISPYGELLVEKKGRVRPYGMDTLRLEPM